MHIGKFGIELVRSAFPVGGNQRNVLAAGFLADLHADSELKTMLSKLANEELKHKEKMEYLYANTAFPQTSGG